MYRSVLLFLAPVALAVAPALPAEEEPGEPFQIQVVDEQTGRGVPLVELRTTNDVRYYTDSAGNVAFSEPGLMDQTVFFHVSSHGYEYPEDGFGYRGKALRVTPGGSAQLKIRRTNIAERLYRVTGGGIYRDTVLLGEKTPIDQPLLNAQVFGSDSVVNAVYRNRIYWFWGDTNRPAYPLGNFHVPGARSRLPGDGGLDPSDGVDLRYFLDDKGFARETARMPGEGPTWIGGLIVLRDGDRERMFAGYVKIRGSLEAYAHGLAEFDDEAERFENVVRFPEGAAAYPTGHPFLHRDGEATHVYFSTPFPLTRVPASPEALADLSQYETFTCLKEGSRLEDPVIDRTDDGRVRYAWRKETPAVGSSEQRKLVEAGLLKPAEALLPLRDVETGRAVMAHGGSVYWNDYRRRWIMIAVEIFGASSFLGEVWYAEADSPLGPWVYARKIVTHDKYSFYNPKQHPMFDQRDDRIIHFEGTYTASFSGNPSPTPRYEYNQVMYRLDLGDQRLALPVPVYDLSGETGENQFQVGLDPAAQERGLPGVPFFALDRPGQDAVAVFSAPGERGGRVLRVGPAEQTENQPTEALFYALPADAESESDDVVPLYEFVNPETGRRAYSIDRHWSAPGYRRERAVCSVWRAYAIDALRGTGVER